MQLFTLFRSQNKGLISTPIFTPNSFYNSLPYFTEKPANPWKNYVLLRAFSLFYTSLKFHCIISSHSCIFRWYNAIIPNLRQNSNISVRSVGDQSILEVLPAVTQHRTAASGFWEAAFCIEVQKKCRERKVWKRKNAELEVQQKKTGKMSLFVFAFRLFSGMLMVSNIWK